MSEEVQDLPQRTDAERLARIQEIWDTARPLVERQQELTAQMRVVRDEWTSIDERLNRLHREVRALSSLPYDGFAAVSEFDGGAA